MADGQVVFEIEGDNRTLKQTLNETTNAIEKESKKWDKAAGDAAGGMEGKMTSMFAKISAAAIAAKVGQTLLEWGRDAVAAASDLEEVQNVVDVTFGESASQIDAWAKTAITQFGLTETQAKQFASTLGAMMKSAGMTGTEIVEMSENLAGLAADMASFYNMDFDTAFQKIRSGISGEVEPLRQLGINMSVASLNAFALEQGLSKTFEQMSQGEQVTLRYQYLMQATADAQGDFARTSDGYANGLRLLESNIESIKTRLGEMLVPALASATSALNDFLTMLTQERQETVLDQFEQIDKDTENKLENIKAATEEARTFIEVLRELDNTKFGVPGADTIAQNYLAMGNESEQAKAGLSALGWSTDQINERQAQWLETCKRLVQTIPGLSEIINTETGEVQGGTKAIEEHVTAWQQAQEKIIMWEAYYAKESALLNSQTRLGELRLDVIGAEQAAKRARTQIEEILKKYGFTNDAAQEIGYFEMQLAGMNSDEIAAYYDNLFKLQDAEKNVAKSTEALRKEEEANAEATQKMQDIEAGLIEKYGEMEKAADGAANATDNATESVKKFDDETAKAAQESIKNFETALKSLTDYTEKAYQSNRQAIASTLSGFAAFQTPAEQAREKMKELELAGKSSAEIIASGFNDAVPSVEKMAAALQGQLDHIKAYQENLVALRAQGFSADVLAMVSDGSAQSMDYAAALRSATGNQNGGQVQEINKLVADVKAASDSLATTMTENTLAVDETMQTLVQNYADALEELNQYDGAKANAAQTVQGIVDGLGENAAAVQSQVNSILSMLAELSNASYGYSVPGVNFNSTVGGGSTTQVHTTINLDGTKVADAVSTHQANGLKTLDRSGWPGGNR